MLQTVFYISQKILHQYEGSAMPLFDIACTIYRCSSCRPELWLTFAHAIISEVTAMVKLMWNLVHCKCSVSMNITGLVKTWCVHIDRNASKHFDYYLNEMPGKSSFFWFSDIQASGIVMRPARTEKIFTVFIKLVLKQNCNVYVFTCYLVVFLAVTSSTSSSFMKFPVQLLWSALLSCYCSHRNIAHKTSRSHWSE